MPKHVLAKGEKPSRRFATHKATAAGKRQTLERKQVRALKYGGAK